MSVGPVEYGAVIFDHDGTLVDSEPITLSVVAEMAVEHGAEVYPEDVDRFVGADLHVVFEEIERRAGKPVPDDFMDTFRSRQEERIRSGLEAIDGAAELIASITVPIAVASNAPVAKMELCLGATGLLDHLDPATLVSAYDVGAWKPDPAVFLAAAGRLGVDPARCAVVEDSRPGVDGALAAGMAVFAYDTGNRFGDVAGLAGRVTSLRDLIPVLGS